MSEFTGGAVAFGDSFNVLQRFQVISETKDCFGSTGRAASCTDVIVYSQQQRQATATTRSTFFRIIYWLFVRSVIRKILFV